MPQNVQLAPLLYLTPNSKTPPFQFVIQENDDDSFLDYIARDNVVNTFLLSLNNPTIDKFSKLNHLNYCHLIKTLILH